MKGWIFAPMLLGALTAFAAEGLEEEVPLSGPPLWNAVLDEKVEFNPAPLESESQEVLRPRDEDEPNVAASEGAATARKARRSN